MGPQPWLYFVLGGQPSTPMFFMPYDGTDTAYDAAAERFFMHGLPDDILLLTSPNMPQKFADRIYEWSARGFTVRKITLPENFGRLFGSQVGYDLPTEVVLLSRPPVR
jgi:hypothetical protein